jgi:uncharacterized membrane protein
MFLVLMIGASFGYRRFLGGQGWADPVAMGFDFAALAFLVSLWPLLRASDVETMRRQAIDNDANRGFILGIATLLSIVVLAAIGGELPRASGGDRLAMLRLVGTLALAWMFANVVYALHYAHLFYTRDADSGSDQGGLDMPGTDAPDYLDFVYFSFTLGMTFQTSDTAITSRAIRRIVTLHSLAAFVFNIGVIAFTINALGGS